MRMPNPHLPAMWTSLTSTRSISGRRLKTVSEHRLHTIRPDVPWEVKNQAAVHLWYEQRFAYAVPRLESIEEAVGTCPRPLASVAQLSTWRFVPGVQSPGAGQGLTPGDTGQSTSPTQPAIRTTNCSGSLKRHTKPRLTSPISAVGTSTMARCRGSGPKRQEPPPPAARNSQRPTVPDQAGGRFVQNR
jgi:hypothetical protein